MGILQRALSGSRRALQRSLERRPTGAWGAGTGALLGATNGAAESERQGGDLQQILAAAALGGVSGANAGFVSGKFLPRGFGLLGANFISPLQGRAIGGAISGGPVMGIGMGDNPENVARRALNRAAQDGDMSEENITRLVEEEGGDETALRYALAQRR